MNAHAYNLCAAWEVDGSGIHLTDEEMEDRRTGSELVCPKGHSQEVVGLGEARLGDPSTCAPAAP